MTFSKTDLAYAAGIIDGEGCIFIMRNWHNRDKRITFVLEVKVSMVDLEALTWLKRFGTKKALHVERRKTVRHNDVWTWLIVGATAEKFLRLILPYLKVKKKQARIALKFRKLLARPGKKLTARNFSERERFYHELRASKKSFKVKGVA